MKTRFLLAGLVALASVCGLAQDYNVNFKVEGLPLSISNQKTVQQGGSYSFQFGLPGGYCLTKIEVERSKPKSSARLFAVSVGVDQYSDGTEIECCGADAAAMRGTFKQVGAGGSYSDLLTGTSATKEDIRIKIADAARMTKSGDIFVYYHSSIGGPGLVRTYDNTYSAEELATDLGTFKEGVKIFVIIDASFAGSFADALNGKANYMLSCKENQQALIFPAINNSAFTGSILLGGRSAWADANNDGLITVEELATGTVGYLKAIKFKKQTPVFGVKDTSDMSTVVTTMVNQDNYGKFSYCLYDNDYHAYVNRYEIPNVQMDYDVTITAAPVENALGNLLEVQKYGVSYKLATEDLEAGLFMKASIATAIYPDGSYDLDVPTEFLGPCMLNGYGAGSFLINIAKFNGKSFSYVMVNRDWLPCGKLAIKANTKKGVVSFKSSIKDVDNYLYQAFDTNLTDFQGYFMMRVNGVLFINENPMTAKFTEGKSYSTKLSK